MRLVCALTIRSLPSAQLTVGRVVSVLSPLALVAFFIPYRIAVLVFFFLFLWSCATRLAMPENAIAQKEHALLLVFMLLPLTIPASIVWVRALWTTGLLTPFEGDHNMFTSVFYLALATHAFANPTGLLVERSALFGFV